MADKAQKKEETKKQLRALLLSAPAALTVIELKRDYHDFMGDPIPYREFGYTSLEDFLKDMPDALRVSWKNGVMCLQPVAQEASVHIQKLVSKQKVNNKNKWATLRRGGPTPRSRSGPTAPRHYRSYVNNNRRPPSQAPPPSFQPMVSAYIRKQIAELLKSYPNGLPVTHFDTAFSRRFGVQLSPTGLGFNSVKDLLSVLPDIAKLKEFQGGELRVSPANNELALGPVYKPQWPKEDVPKYKPHRVERQVNNYQQNQEELWDSNRGFQETFENVQTERKSQSSQMDFKPAGMEDWNSMEDISYEMPEQGSNSKNWRATQQKTLQSIPSGVATSPPPMSQTPRGRGRRRTGDRKDVDTRSHEHDSFSSGGSHEAAASPGAGTFDDSIISEAVQNNIRQILEERSEGLWAIQLPTEYMKRYNKELSFQEYGYWNLVEMLASLPDVVHLERPKDNGDWLCFDARIPAPKKPVVQKRQTRPTKKESAPVKGRYSSRGEFDPLLEEKVRQVLQCKPKGVLLNQFPSVYKELTGEELPYKKLGYDKIEFFMIPLTDSVVHLEYKGDGCMLVFAIDNGNPPQRDLIINPPQNEKERGTMDIPSDAVGPKVYYKPQDLPPIGQYIEIFVSNVVSPGLFWVQIRGKHTTLALDKCMNELEKIYCSAESDQYKVPDYLLTVGQIVAAVFPEDNNWHRCVVTALNVDRYVEVYFVDFGNTSVVHRSQIRLLRSHLLKLPAQAIQARLAHLQPAGEATKTWTLNARNRLLNLVTNRPLIALTGYEKDRVLSLVLVDTSTKVDICLNDLLVTEVYAQMIEDNPATNFTGPPGHKEVPNYAHVYGDGYQPKEEPETPVQPEAENKGEITEELSRRFVQPIQLTGDYVVNLINLEDTAYLMSAEVSAFFWDADVLASMLEQYHRQVSRLTVRQEDYPEVFEDLHQCGVFPANEKKSITLYKLQSVPFILKTFGHKSEELHTNVNELIQMFDPNDPFWKGEDYPDSETTSQLSEDLSDVQVSLEDIQLSLQLLQFKRKRILQNLMTHPENMVDDVNELKEVEEQIGVLKEMQDQVRQRKALDPDSPEKQVSTKISSPASSGIAASEAAVSTSKADQSRPPLPPKGTTQLGIPQANVSNVSPVKMNVVAPMQSMSNQSKPVQTSQLQSMPSNPANPLLLAQQQLLLQSMIMQQQQQQQQSPLQSLGQHMGAPGQIPSLNNQFVRGTLPFQQNVMNQQYAARQAAASFNLNQQFAATSQTSAAGMPPLLNYMQANLAVNPYLTGMPCMGNLGGVAQPPQQPPQQPQQQQSDMPLLPGLLPLLQSLNINQGQGSSSSKPPQQ